MIDIYYILWYNSKSTQRKESYMTESGLGLADIREPLTVSLGKRSVKVIAAQYPSPVLIGYIGTRMIFRINGAIVIL